MPVSSSKEIKILTGSCSEALVKPYTSEAPPKQEAVGGVETCGVRPKAPRARLRRFLAKGRVRPNPAALPKGQVGIRGLNCPVRAAVQAMWLKHERGNL